MTNCGHCHTCGTRLRSVLDGEEWCPTCQTYRRYRSHGLAAGAADRADSGWQPVQTPARPPLSVTTTTSP